MAWEKSQKFRFFKILGLMSDAEGGVVARRERFIC